MTNAQSKVTGIVCSCKDSLHPWTDSCLNASLEVLFAGISYGLRVYSIVYVLSLLMRRRIPKLEQLKKTLLGIVQSTAFLSINAMGLWSYNCLIRNILGRFYMPTAAFWPAFFASYMSILIERKPRASLLALYVANVATETLWNMAEARGYVRSLPHATTAIFGISVSILLYLYRLGLHRSEHKDIIFSALQFLLGKKEEGPLLQQKELSTTMSTSLLHRRHVSCPHSGSCSSYAVMDSLQPFAVGVGLQLSLRILMNFKRIVRMRMPWRKSILNAGTLKWGIFWGGFSLLYKSVSCLLRHSFERDDARFALPAGLIASLSFMSSSSTTISLYVMWKMLHILYNYGISLGKLPLVPGFNYLLYAVSTGLLFHANVLEPVMQRHSYVKFLENLSRGKCSGINRQPFDAFGLNSSEQQQQIMRRLKL